MKVRQLSPNYVELVEPQSANVSSLEELLELPWIKLLAQKKHKFYRFSCNRMNDHFLLMAELKKGAWRVVAIVSGDDFDHIMNPLPVWTCS
jgi:hypothetical protein